MPALAPPAGRARPGRWSRDVSATEPAAAGVAVALVLVDELRDRSAIARHAGLGG
jgi:hypothetical protein